MSFIDLFPTVISKTQLSLDSFQLESYKNFILSSLLSKQDNNYKTTNNQQLLEDPIFNTLNLSILSNAKKYLDIIGHEYETLQIASSWGVVIDQGGYGGAHSHVNSYISGVFYLSSGSPLGFINPSLNKWQFLPNINQKDYRSYNGFLITPQPNLLTIFPSWLQHHISPSLEDERVSIAFNIIPKGKFGIDTGMLYLK